MVHGIHRDNHKILFSRLNFFEESRKNNKKLKKRILSADDWIEKVFK